MKDATGQKDVRRPPHVAAPASDNMSAHPLQATAQQDSSNELPPGAPPSASALANPSDSAKLVAQFRDIDTWVFDLDNTLYPASSDLWPKIDQRITLYLIRLFGLDGMSSRALQKYYYQRYGTTLRGLIVDHGVSFEDYLAFVHDIDRSSLAPNDVLAAAITRLPGRKLILTNGSRDHALRTAEALGLEKIFEDIFDIVAGDLVSKPAGAVYERFFDKHGVDPKHSAMFEDLVQNLLVPYAAGMTTTLVLPQPGGRDHREAFEIPQGAFPPHVHFVTYDLARFLRDIADANEATRPASAP